MDIEEEVVDLFGEDDDKPSGAVTKPVENLDALEATFEMPKKFEGKSKEDIAEAYTNLEKESGRRSNELGELRKLTDDILRKQVNQPQDGEDFINESEEEFDFFDDPAKAVDKAIRDNPRMQQLEDQLLRDVQRTAHAKLIESHSDADEVVASQKFNDWVKGSPSRLKMLQDAHNQNDVAMASDIISMYKHTAGNINAEAIVTRDAQAATELKAASIERGSPSTSSEPIYRREDLIRLKLEDPNRYSAMSEDIRSAYADGRVK